MDKIWTKRFFDLHYKEWISELKEKFGAEGFLAYDVLLETFANLPTCKIPISGMLYKKFLMNVQIDSLIENKQTLENIIEFLIEKKILIKDKEYLYSKEILEVVQNLKDFRKKKSEAGKKSGKVRKQKSLDNKLKPTDKSNSEIKQEITEESFNNNLDDFENIPEENNNELNLKRIINLTNNKTFDKFSELITVFFLIAPDYSMIKNRQEKKAYILLLNMIDENIFKHFNKDYLETIIEKISDKSDPNFYLSSLYDQIVKDIVNYSKESKDEWVIQAKNKYSFLKNMPSLV